MSENCDIQYVVYVVYVKSSYDMQVQNCNHIYCSFTQIPELKV